MWIYFAGPFVSLLPRRWRRRLSFHDGVHWYSASIVSGLAESLTALGALLFWYSYAVTTWVSRLLDNALSKSGPVEISDHEIGFAGLLVWATHPLTWLIAYFVIEGAVRLCAAFTDTVVGSLPLYVAERIYSKLRGHGEPPPPGAPLFAHSHMRSYVGTMRERVRNARLAEVPDELQFSTVDGEVILAIHASRGKSDWNPPRVVRCEDRYYRLEEFVEGSPPRPYIYKLRRLSKGVAGRNVLVYVPAEASVITNR